MERTQAFKTLRLHETADGEMVQTAYWTLVRQAQNRAGSDIGARAEVEALNEAYATLQPDGRRKEPAAPVRSGPARAEAGEPPAGTEWLDRAVNWLSDQALRTRQRWAGRNPEIAVIAGTALVLAFVALAEGVSFWIFVVCLVLIFGAIWAPWRRA